MVFDISRFVMAQKGLVTFSVFQVTDDDLKQYAVANKQPLGKTSNGIYFKQQVSTASVAISAFLTGRCSIFNACISAVQTQAQAIAT